MKNIACFIFAVLVVLFITGAAVDFIRFPECYISTSRYRLQCDLNANDEQAIEYYNSRYMAHGRELFN